MTRPDPDLVAELFDEASQLSSAARETFLRDRCGDDDALRHEVEQLLNHDADASGSFLHSPLKENAGGLGLQPGDRIAGRYELVRVLGEGGMSVVWLARQAQPARDVAVKFMNPALFNDDRRRRFEFETNVLARLRHPGIAQIFEAGHHELRGGTCPFFVMEYVEGAPLDVGAAAQSVDDRLQLFAQVCDAVHYAHQKGVIHRDLKPANIMLGPEGHPKVLDFGVARSIDPDLRHTQQTTPGQLVGTLPYMSPEQVEGGSDLDVRSDVYALGVVLYQLLSGRLPLEFERQGFASAIRTIVQQEPLALSSLDRQFRGDLETITQRALEKEPSRRYASASELGADVRRYLDSEPIMARPATAMYTLRKFARRNKAAFAAAVLAVLALMLGLVGTSLGMFSARREAERATAMNDFLREVVVSSDPVFGRADVKFVDVLKAAVPQIDEHFAEYPDLGVGLHELFSRSFYNLDLLDDGIQQSLATYDRAVAAFGEADARTLDIASLVAATYMKMAQIAEVEEYASRVLAHDENNPVAGARCRVMLAHIKSMRGEFDEADALLAAAIKMADDLEPPNMQSRLDARRNLAESWRLQSHIADPATQTALLDRAELLLRETMDIAMTEVKYDDYPMLTLRSQYAQLLFLQEKFDEAEPLLREMSDLEGRVGSGHGIKLSAMASLSTIELRRGNFEEAASLSVQCVEQSIKTHGESATGTLSMMADAISSLEPAKRPEGLGYARQVADRFGIHFGEKSRLTAQFRVFEARFLAIDGEHDAAAALLDEVSSWPSVQGDAELPKLIEFMRLANAIGAGQTEGAAARLKDLREGIADPLMRWRIELEISRLND